MDLEAAAILGKLIGAGLAMIGAIGAGAGIGIVTSGAVQAMGRNPFEGDLFVFCRRHLLSGCRTPDFVRLLNARRLLWKSWVLISGLSSSIYSIS